MRRAAGLALVLICGAAQAAHGAERPFCADRPGKATPPCILDTGRLQLEVAPLDAVFDHGEESYDIAGFELRYGVTPRVEVELSGAPWMVQRHGPQGVGDFSLGLRAALTDPDADGPAASVQPFVTAPTATRGQGAGGWEGGVRAPISAPLRGGASVGLTPELDLVRDADGHGVHAAYAAVLALGRSFGPATLGVELWGQLDEDPTKRTTAASADLTAAYSPASAPDLQLDAGLNAGLNRQTPGLEVYVGVARRF